MIDWQSRISGLSSRWKGRLQRSLAAWLARRPMTMRSREAIISFTFDDFPRSAAGIGGRILAQHGLAGTYFVSLGLMGQLTPTGPAFLREDLDHVVAQGHELGCHTFNHAHAWDTSPSRFEAAILENQVALKKLLPDASFRTLSYPISCPRPGNKRKAAKYFGGCRSGGQTFNLGTVDLSHLAGYFLEQSRDRPEAVREMIRQTRERGAWLILATHDVCDNPTRFGCTPAFFERVVGEAVTSGASILPMGRALEVIGGRVSGASRR